MQIISKVREEDDSFFETKLSSWINKKVMRTVDVFLRIIGLKRKKPVTKLGRMLRKLEIVITVLAGVYLIVQVFPQVLFAHSFGFQGLTLYSRSGFPEETADLLSLIHARLEQTELYKEEYRFSIFLCNSKLIYSFFAPFSRHSFAIWNPITTKIFMADVDLGTNQSRAFRDLHNKRFFVEVAVHEVVHSLIRQRLGIFAERRAPKWLKEGYCELIAGGGSFPQDRGDRMLAERKLEDSDSGSFRYFVYRRMVEYLVIEKKFNIGLLISNPPDGQQVQEEARRWIMFKIRKDTQR